MYKICKTERSMERQKLFQTTLFSMMEQQSYHDITVTALTKEMKIPRKTFYRYYDTLEDVLFATIDESITSSFLYLEVKADLEGFFSYWKKNKYLMDVLEKNGLSPLLINRIYEKFDRRLEEEKSGKRIISNRDLKYSGYIAAIMTMLVSWHHSGMHQTPNEMSTLVREMFRID
ncbi:MAG: TetR/AcrR family transcriptional regulator [Agathobacter sp.]|nr:TetR/AcrR family transcriptional regulator [Agathobacter sp.]